LLSYRAGSSEPGPEKSFNFSKEAASERWDACFLDMRFALDGVQADSNGIKVVRRPG
jgi:NTE family protein